MILSTLLLIASSAFAVDLKAPESPAEASRPLDASAALPPNLPQPLALPTVDPAPIFDGAGLRTQIYAVREQTAGPLPQEARDHHYLLVPGFSWDAIPDYFGPNLKRLQKLGLSAERVDVDPLGTFFDNAKPVRDAVLASEKPVVLIGHSKGGFDLLEALERFPELRPKVAKVVLLQTPYRGTSVADWFMTFPWLYTTAMAYSRLLNPWRLFATNPFYRHRTLTEMSASHRRKVAGRPPDIGGIPVYSVSSRVDDDTRIKLLLWLTAGSVKAATGYHNDGIVAPEQAVVPGAIHAVLEHVGHIDTITDPSSWKHKILGVRGHDPSFAADLTEAVVRWVFADPEK